MWLNYVEFQIWKADISFCSYWNQKMEPCFEKIFEIFTAMNSPVTLTQWKKNSCISKHHVGSKVLDPMPTFGNRTFEIFSIPDLIATKLRELFGGKRWKPCLSLDAQGTGIDGRIASFSASTLEMYLASNVWRLSFWGSSAELMHKLDYVLWNRIGAFWSVSEAFSWSMRFFL